MKNDPPSPSPKFSPKPVKRPIRMVLSTSDSPHPRTPHVTVKKGKKGKK